LKYFIAIILLVIAILIFYLFRSRRSLADIRETQRISAFKNIIPAANRATLTLDNGAAMALDSESIGLLAHQGNTTISKTAEDCLSYLVDNKGSANIEYNVLSTPPGGQYRLVLPDSSRVWLNAASSINFPSAFTGTQRLVRITGEVYFEIVPKTNMPFVVKLKDQVVENLGTAFNIKAYPEEEVFITTPIRGAVKVFLDTNTILLQPGQQELTYGQSIVRKDGVDLENTLAWHRGFFVFDGNSLKDIMGQIGRWYDLHIKYDGPFSPGKYEGRINSRVPLADVLVLLEKQGIRFKLEGKVLYVSDEIAH
jgi:transmembrane sensor